MSSSIASVDALDLCGELDKLPANDSASVDEGAKRAPVGSNDTFLNNDGANQGCAEMTWLARKLMSHLVGHSISRALASYMENQDIKGL